MSWRFAALKERTQRVMKDKVKPNMHVMGPPNAKVMEAEDKMQWPRTVETQAWENCVAALVSRLLGTGLDVREVILQGMRMAGACGAMEAERLVSDPAFFGKVNVERGTLVR